MGAFPGTTSFASEADINTENSKTGKSIVKKRKDRGTVLVIILLNHVKPEDATGKVAEAYSVFPKGVPVPAPLTLMSASPDLAHAQSNIIRYYMGHEKLDTGLLAMIRYLVANELDYRFCIDFNAGLLKMAGGFSDDDLERRKGHD